MGDGEKDGPDGGPALARRAWRALEPYHALVYFAPEARAAYAAVGLRGFWMGYFASRATALGAASPEVIAAIFYNFAPRMVARAIPDAWHLASPERVLAARFGAVAAALRRFLGAGAASAAVAEAAELARRAVAGCDRAGRPLFAAHLALDRSAAPHLALRHAATLLREFRGDGHSAALLVGGLDGCEAHVTQAASGAAPREVLQPNRGWSDEERAAAEARLRRRGWLEMAEALTVDGRAGREAVEAHTDALAVPPWRRLGDPASARLLTLVRPLSAVIVEQGGIPVPNPTRIPWP